MGSTYAAGIAGENIPLEVKLEWHLRGNHYPPVPRSMIEPCKQAIEAGLERDFDLEIKLPAGIKIKGSDTARAGDICELLHLEPFLDIEPWEEG